MIPLKILPLPAPPAFFQPGRSGVGFCTFFIPYSGRSRERQKIKPRRKVFKNFFMGPPFKLIWKQRKIKKDPASTKGSWVSVIMVGIMKLSLAELRRTSCCLETVLPKAAVISSLSLKTADRNLCLAITQYTYILDHHRLILLPMRIYKTLFA